MAPKKRPFMLIRKTEAAEQERRQIPETLDIDRRVQPDRREQIVARGYFEQYFNLYNMMYESSSVTPEISQLLAKILDDPEWQAVLAQEVSTDRLFRKKKSRKELRNFFRKHGVIEEASSHPGKTRVHSQP